MVAGIEAETGEQLKNGKKTVLGKSGILAQHPHVSRVAGAAGNYRYFLMAGGRHVTIYRGGFYAEEAGGVRFRDWVADLADGRAVESVRCAGCR
jgi:hypothetical protein